MRIIKPVKVTTEGLISSSVNEDDYPQWDAGAHAQGYRCISGNRVYEVLAESTMVKPEDGAKSSPPAWLDLGATNRWRMFDDKVGSTTKRLGTIDVELLPGGVINSVALFNVTGREVAVKLDDPVDGIVYEKRISLVDVGSSSWYEYFFEPFGRRSDITLLDIPAYGTAAILVTIDNAADIAACGNLVMGRQAVIGSSLYGATVGITDYSRKESDSFGNSAITERAFSKRAEFDLAIETAQVHKIQSMLAEIRAVPVVWIGEESYEATVIFGYYRDFSISISGPSVSDATITIEGLT